MSGQTILAGGCLCGALRYEAAGTPGMTAICHCRMCQPLSGGPFMALLFMASEAVKVTKGRLSIYPSSPSQPAFLRRVRLAGALQAARALIAAIALGSLDK